MSIAVRSGLWALFCLLLLAGGWLFLRACGTWPVFGWAKNFCPLPMERTDEAREGEMLRRQVHAAEIALAEIPPCPVRPTPAPQPQRPVAPSPPPPASGPPPQRAESRALDRKVEERGGKRGRLQLTLAWNTRDDLDINVDCPGGRIGSTAGQRGPGICGDGVKDIDANRDLKENMSSTPIENIAWEGEIPSGTYKIEIIEYRAQGTAGDTVPFTLRMRLDDEEKICSDVVTTLPDAEVRMNNGKIIGGTYRTIVLQSDQPLPDCTFTTENSLRGGGHK